MSTRTLTRAGMAIEIAEITDKAQHIRINEGRLAELAQRIANQVRESQGQDLAGNLVDPAEAPIENNRDTLQYFLVRRSQSFVIWRWTGDQARPTEAWDCHVGGKLYTGERAVNACIMRAMSNGVPLLDPSYLEKITLPELEDIYRDEITGQVTYQLLEWRLEKLHEIGAVLNDRYDGHMANLLEQADGRLFREDGLGSIQQLVDHFPKSYGDRPFAKLAITLMNALHSRRDVPELASSEEFSRLTRIEDPENFFGPTDYYIPLFLIRWGVFEASSELRQALESRTRIEQGSDMEREYRAATLTVFDRVQELTGTSLAHLDYEFWYTGAFRCRPCHPGATQEEVPCPYREDCTGYQREKSLMDLGWPLVYTPFY